MNAKTLEAVKRHGESILAAFPNATEKDPVALCKKLRRIETVTHRAMTAFCNGEIGEVEADRAEATALTRLLKLLSHGANSFAGECVFVNRDPRGYALKIQSESTAKQNELNRKLWKPAIHTDFGGYGILAPDLTR